MKEEIICTQQKIRQMFLIVWSQGKCIRATLVLDNGQRNASLLYFTIYLLRFSTCFEHYMLIARRLNCIAAASGIVTLS